MLSYYIVVGCVLLVLRWLEPLLDTLFLAGALAKSIPRICRKVWLASLVVFNHLYYNIFIHCIHAVFVDHVILVLRELSGTSKKLKVTIMKPQGIMLRM